MIYLYETVDIIFLINLIVAFWNCCLALFKSSLRSPEQSRYLETCKIHGEKRGSHDRCFTDFGTAICPCRPIEVIAVSAVNSGSNNSDYSPSLSHPSSLFLVLSSLYSRSYSSGPGKLWSCWYFASAKRSANSIGYYETILYHEERRARRQPYISVVHIGRIPDVNTTEVRPQCKYDQVFVVTVQNPVSVVTNYRAKSF